MNEDKLVLNTKKSLYEPVEIEIDGQVYQSVKTTRAMLTEIGKLETGITKNKDVELYKVVQLLFNVEPKILEKLDKREVQDIYTFFNKKILEIEKQRLDIITRSFSKVFPGQKVVKEIPPSQKRPGSKQ